MGNGTAEAAAGVRSGGNAARGRLKEKPAAWRNKELLYLEIADTRRKLDETLKQAARKFALALLAQGAAWRKTLPGGDQIMKINKEKLRENLTQPTNRVIKVVQDKPYTSLAALTTFGIGMAMLLPRNRHRLMTAAGAGKAPVAPVAPIEPPSSSMNDYYEAAPRAIRGSHRSFEEFAESGSGKVVKTGGLVLGTAAALTTLYFLGKKK